MTGAPRPWWRPRLDGLAPRVAAFLTLALLPLGLIALWQTREFQNESERRAELSLIALTEQGGAGIRSALEGAIGAGEALGVVGDLLADPATCESYLDRFVESRDRFDYVALLSADGPPDCASPGAPIELWAGFDMEELAAEPRVRVRIARHPSGEVMLVVAVPADRADAPDDGQARYVAVALPRDDVLGTRPGLPQLRPVRLVTYDEAGQVLTAQGRGVSDPPLGLLLPGGRPLSGEAGGEPRLFEAVDSSGEPHAYTVAPLVPGVAYALAIWTPDQAARGLGGAAGSPLLFPILMWAISLLVAFWSIHSLMIQRVTDLVARMRRFGRDRSLSEARPGPSAAYELREMDDAFRNMAGSILQDEARMENAFRERGVLLREVHHRVKNNLQLISSIISMQVRRMPDPRTRAILRRLQDRVLTLATIYRSLYTSPDLGDVNVAPILRTIVEQEMRAAGDRAEAMLDIEDIVLDPDKAVPLSFLAAEAVSNAIAGAGSDHGRPTISVTLHRDGPDARLRIANSLGQGAAPDASVQGLGHHLIQAFASQVGGPVEAGARDGLYVVAVTFPIRADATQPVDA